MTGIQSSAVKKHSNKWRVVDIVVAAIVPIGAFDSLTPGLGGLFNFMWLFAGPLAAIIVRKPGAAFFAETVAALIEALMGNPFGIGGSLIIGMFQGLGAEIGFAVFAYKKWNIASVTLAGALTGLFNGGYDWLTHSGWTMLQGSTFTICCVISGAVMGGAFMWVVQFALAKTGVLDRFESGRMQELV